jgi:hypothetical protein
MKIFKKLLAAIASGTVLVTMLTAPAFGGEWSGDDDQHSGTNREGRWQTVYPTASQTAFERYERALYWSNNAEHFLREYRGMSPAQVQICKDAEFIWFWGYEDGKHIAPNGNTNNTRLPTRATSPWGRAASSSEWNAWMTYGTKLYPQWHQGRMSIICASDSWLESEVTEREYEYRTQEVDRIDLEGVVTLHTSIEPGIGFSNEFGEHALQAQSLTDRTAYGKLYDEIKAGKHDDKSHAQLKNMIQTAISQSDPKGQTPASLWAELSDANRASMAEGGVLNVTERHMKAPVELSKSQRQRRYRNITYRVKPDGSKTVKNRSSWSSWRDYGAEREHMRPLEESSIRTHAFFQMLSVRCNVDDFRALTQTINGFEVSPDTDYETTMVGFSPTQKTSSPTPILGNASHSNSAIAATGTVNFFTAECDLSCKPSTPSEDETEDSVLLGSHGESNSLAFVRDNQPKSITVPVAVPETTGTNIASVTPVQTVVERWGDSTPNVRGGGSRFTMNAVSSDGDKTRLFTGNDNLRVHNDRRLSPGSNAGVSILDDVFSEFTVQADWASLKDRPVVLRTGHVYEADVQTGVPSYLRTGGSNRTVTNTRTSHVVVEDSTVHSRCMTQFGNGDRSYSSSDLVERTGSGKEYSALEFDFSEKAPEDYADLLVIDFLRNVSER